jgi:hypothetical protein
MRVHVHVFLAVLVTLAGCARGGRSEPAPAPVHVAPTAPRDAAVGAAGDSATARLMALLEPCRRAALAAWPEARQRFLAGLPAQQTLFVTTRLRDAVGRVEQVFVAVDHIDGGRVAGRLWSEVTTVVGYRRGQPLALAEADVVDWMISRPDGSEEGNWMGKFIDAYQATGAPPVGGCGP